MLLGLGNVELENSVIVHRNNIVCLDIRRQRYFSTETTIVAFHKVNLILLARFLFLSLSLDHEDVVFGSNLDILLLHSRNIDTELIALLALAHIHSSKS